MAHRLLRILLAFGITGAAHARDYHQPIEPIDLPPSIQQGVDLIYIDPELAPALRQRDGLLQQIGVGDRPGEAIDLFRPVHPFYTDLRRGLMRYRAKWGRLPQLKIPSGPTLKPGTAGERVAMLRSRLGLAESGNYDAPLAAAVKEYQRVHGIKADGVAGEATIASLNLGTEHYERLAIVNLERARRLPTPDERGRYVLVDAGAAQVYMFEDGRLQDSMKAVVGKPASATPMMAAMIRYASVNPYWNVPPDLAQTLIAPRVLSDGLGYLQASGYEVLSDWSDEATVIDPASVDWAAVARKEIEIRVRQLPGQDNSMGGIKFMMPNDFGIYLHDTPNRAPFQSDERWISNGCVRVEDAQRLAGWLFGTPPVGRDPHAEERVDLDSPVPVYITYMTAAPAEEGLVFRKDPYERDARLLASYFGPKDELASRTD